MAGPSNAPFVADFQPTKATLERIIQGLAELDPTLSECGAQERRAALAEYVQRGRGLVLPDARLRWAWGELRSSQRQIQAADRSGGIVHIGSLSVPQANPGLAALGARIATLTDAQGDYARLLAEVCPHGIAPPTTRVGALITAFQNSGVVLMIPDGAVIPEPIQLIWTYPAGSASAVFPIISLALGRGARASVIERHIGEGDTFLCGLTQIFAAEDAHLDYVVVQQTSDNARVHMIRTSQAQTRSTINWYLAELGAGALHAYHDVQLAGVQARSTIAALSIRTGMERLAVRTRLDQRNRETSAHSIWRIALGERGRAELRDHVHIRKWASKSSALAAQDALLFSRRAQVLMEPKRTAQNHRSSVNQRATVGSIDDEALFYVLTRGIPRSEAIRMIALAFFEPAVGRFPGSTLQDEIRTALDDRIDALTLGTD